MKRNNFPKSVLLLLVAGLLMTSLPPIVDRHFPLPDLLRGFLGGLGLTLEVIALVKMQRLRKNAKCTEIKPV
ncbi:hypothetical protein GZH53_11600 [Flavihumibacter sp. R14]|nr:hypothetical protein [Flavihumibacter soli]